MAHTAIVCPHLDKGAVAGDGLAVIAREVAPVDVLILSVGMMPLHCSLASEARLPAHDRTLMASPHARSHTHERVVPMDPRGGGRWPRRHPRGRNTCTPRFGFSRGPNQRFAVRGGSATAQAQCAALKTAEQAPSTSRPRPRLSKRRVADCRASPRAVPRLSSMLSSLSRSGGADQRVGYIKRECQGARHERESPHDDSARWTRCVTWEARSTDDANTRQSGPKRES